jgi:ABC-type Fe3+-hydroxamate transport system substrate-binding protein
MRAGSTSSACSRCDPTVVLVWQRGATSRELEQLEAAGDPPVPARAAPLDDVARAIERLGALLGHEEERDGARGSCAKRSTACAPSTPPLSR